MLAGARQVSRRGWKKTCKAQEGCTEYQPDPVPKERSWAPVSSFIAGRGGRLDLGDVIFGFFSPGGDVWPDAQSGSYPSRQRPGISLRRAAAPVDPSISACPLTFD